MKITKEVIFYNIYSRNEQFHDCLAFILESDKRELNIIQDLVIRCKKEKGETNDTKPEYN